MANPLKGQIKVSLGGEDNNVRQTIDSLMQIESALDKGIIKLANDMAQGDVRLSDLSAILLPALRGGGNNLQQKDVNKLIGEVGIVEATKVVVNLLAQTLTDDSDEKSEVAENEGK